MGRIIRLYKRYFTYRHTVRRQLRQKVSSPRLYQRRYDHRIFLNLIDTSHYQALHMLALAKALELRGAEIVVLVCNSELPGCEAKSVETEGRIDECLECRFHRNRVLQLFDFKVLHFKDLLDASEFDDYKRIARNVVKDYPDRYVVSGVDVIPIVDDSVTRFFYGDVPWNDREQLRKVREHQLCTALISLQFFERLLETFKPHSVLSNMTVYSPWAPIYKKARALGMNYDSLYLTPWDYGKVRLNSPDLALSNARYKAYVAARDSPMLEEEEKEALNRFLTNRFSGDARVFTENRWFDHTGDVSLRRTLNIDRAKRNILLPTNLFWDKGLNDLHLLFKDVFDLCVFTIKAIRGHPEVHLYIKIHPAEQFYGKPHRTGVMEVLLERLGDLPQNVTFITPEMRVNTYELIGHMDLGVLLNGTVGLEMMLMDKPIICVGQAPYRGVGIANEPGGLAEYKSLLLGREVCKVPDEEKVQLFAYFYFIKSLIPWTLTSQAFNDPFDGFMFDSLKELLPGEDIYLDHLCKAILDPENTVIEAWPDECPTDTSTRTTLRS